MISKFATVINCMDGRIQDPVNSWMKKTTGAEFVDVITEAGPDRIMASTATASRLILQRILVSRDNHGSTELALIGHHDCAGNPVSDDLHRAHLLKAGRILETWNLGMHIMLVWVGEGWNPEIIAEINP